MRGKGSALTNAKGMVIIIIYYEIRILAETKKTGFFPNRQLVNVTDNKQVSLSRRPRRVKKG